MTEFRLSYSAPSSCPSKQEFLDAMLRRFGQARESVAPDAGLLLDVAIEARGAEAVGALRIIEGQLSTTREIPAAQCADVVDSIAVIAALLLERRAASGSALRPDVSGEADAGTDQSEPASSAAESVAAPRVRVQSAAREEKEVTLAKTAATPKVSRLRMGAALMLAAETGAAPDVMPALGGGAEAWLERKSWFSPTGRLSALYGRQRVSTEFGGADFQLLALRAQLCPVRLELARFAFTPCSVADFGELRARGRDVERPRTEKMPWVAAGLSLRASRELNRTFSVEAGADLRVLAFRDRFVLQPGGQLVYQVRDLAFSAGLGVVARLP